MTTKIAVICDGSYNKYYNYASIACSFAYKDITYDYSNLIDSVQYQESLARLDSFFVELYSILFSLEKLIELSLVREPIELVNDNDEAIKLLNICIEKYKRGLNIYFINNDITKFLLRIIKLYKKFDRLEFKFMPRKYTKQAHDLCRKETLPLIKERRIKLIRVEHLCQNLYIAFNTKRGTTYIVNVEKQTCDCRFFYYENKEKMEVVLCKHIIAVNKFIKNNNLKEI